MNEALPVQVTALAARQIREARAWWQRNRAAAPNAIEEELQRAFSLIAAQPAAGGRAANVKLPDVRRIFLPRIKYHLYYHVLHVPERVEVVAFWHSRRGAAPPI
jgi:plasmid stabilization system protein ParE